MELAELKPAIAWVRSRRSLGSNSRFFQDLRGRPPPLPVTSYRWITRGFPAIWSQVLRFVTRSVIDSERRMCLSQAARPGRRISASPTMSGKARAIGATPNPCRSSAGKRLRRRCVGPKADTAAAPSRECGSVDDSAALDSRSPVSSNGAVRLSSNAASSRSSFRGIGGQPARPHGRRRRDAHLWRRAGRPCCEP
jgi:hypothetical protein